jgi:bleomycin hydrolase
MRTQKRNKPNFGLYSKAVLFFLSILCIQNFNAIAQDDSDEADSSAYQFTMIKDLPVTSVKDQYRSGTCWAFSGLSFLESELLRLGKGEHDLSEMWLVKKDYHLRAIDYVRWQGAKNFGGGAESNNVMDRIKDSGIVPEEAFPGLNYGEKKHVHGEMDALLDAYVNAVVKDKNRKLTPAWIKGFDGVLDAYLGVDVKSFAYQGKTYTPESFRDALEIYPDDYIEIASFLHHPMYQKFVMEVPDNWSLGEVYNVPLDELLKTAYYALDHGYTILWGSDVSEKGFSYKNGVAIVPQTEPAEMADNERNKWEKLSEKERKKQLFEFKEIVPETHITPEIRQQAFDNYQTTDDHGMHITGCATDQNGTHYFKVKNSWDTDNIYEGYFFASESWFLYKTLSIMVHKDAVPKELLNKLGMNKR